MSYDHKAIEAKWQGRWESERIFYVDADDSRPKFYNVCMYPYPSGAIHQGHVRNYTYGDLLTRYKRMKGFNVLSPMGWDSFGLNAENAAISSGVHPRINTEANIETMKGQIKQLGSMYDWGRELASHHPDFYKWDQWLFLKLHRRGLAYKTEAPVNWCPKDQTVLANEQVIDGECERCGTQVVHKDLEQWFFKITDYADRLLSDIEKLEHWPDRVRTMQRNWIGRSEGAQFAIEVDKGGSFQVFTTRPDTVFGMTFCVLAPEHPLVGDLISGNATESEAREYIDKANRASEIERLAEGDKTGVFTSAYALNPVNGRKVPIYIADYVLMGYGTGAIMAVPGQDQRDWDFATKYGIEIIRTVEPPDGWEGDAYTGDGPTINSDFLDGLDMAGAKERIISWLVEKGIGEGTVNYRLRDWLISRQRYWGCPIPMVNCEECGLVPVPESELPVLLPDIEDYLPKGRSPLAAVDEFVNTTCPKCDGPAETRDRHHGHVRRLVVVLLSLSGCAQRRGDIRTFTARLLDAPRPVHRRRRARNPPSALRQVHNEGPPRHGDVERRRTVRPVVHPGDDHFGWCQDVEIEGQRRRPCRSLRITRCRRTPSLSPLHGATYR